MNNATHIPSSSGTFGLERETLRVTSDGRMAHTPHPFPDDAHIVKDFCENQAEINTGVHAAAQGAVDELLEQGERLTVREAGNRVLDTMRTYYGEDQRATALLQYQQDKLKTPCGRYAERVVKDFYDNYAGLMI